MKQKRPLFESLTGLVLCGGMSTRMGVDKGLIHEDGEPWFIRTGNLVTSFDIPVLYSIRSEQASLYSTYVESNSLIIDTAISEGPLRGVFSGFKFTHAKALLVIACDMQALKPLTIQSLLDAYKVDEHDFYAYSDGKFYQPFPGIYTRVGLQKMPEAKSLQQLLQMGITCPLRISDDTMFQNYNQLP